MSVTTAPTAGRSPPPTTTPTSTAVTSARARACSVSWSARSSRCSTTATRRCAGSVDQQDEGQLAHTRPLRHGGADGAANTPPSCTNLLRQAQQRCSATTRHAARRWRIGSSTSSEPGPTSRWSISTSTRRQLTKVTSEPFELVSSSVASMPARSLCRRCTARSTRPARSSGSRHRHLAADRRGAFEGTYTVGRGRPVRSDACARFPTTTT